MHADQTHNGKAAQQPDNNSVFISHTKSACSLHACLTLTVAFSI